MQVGLQIRLRRFDSDLGLHHSKAPQTNVCGVFLYGSKKPRVPKLLAWSFKNSAFGELGDGANATINALGDPLF